MTGITPNRGSTEGGTVVTISGSGFSKVAANLVQVSLGQTNCTLVTVVSDTTIQCTSAKPDPKPYGAAAVNVLLLGLGMATGRIYDILADVMKNVLQKILYTAVITQQNMRRLHLSMSEIVFYTGIGILNNLICGILNF